MISVEGDPTYDVILLDEPVLIRLELGGLTASERTALSSLADVLEVRPGEVLLRRNRRHVVGRCVVGRWTISVPPQFDGRLLLQLVLYAYRLDVGAVRQQGLVDVSLKFASQLDVFLQMMAAVLVTEAQRIVSSHIAQSYEQRQERSHNPKGRLLWTKDFGRHPGQGVTHTHPLKTTDNAVNRATFAGIRVATRLLAASTLAGDAYRQAFVWRELASEVTPSASAFDLTLLRLDRLTEHYRTALVLSRALVMGLTPLDYFTGSAGAVLPALQFNIPVIFERFLERLLSEVGADNPRLAVRAQAPDRLAILDESGGTYREVRPDLELFIGDKPAAVLDAKFKPQYVSGDDDARKVSNADIYQLLFYQARLAEVAGRTVLPAAIVAPQLSVAPLMSTWPRQMIWRIPGRESRTVMLLPLALGPVLARLERGSAWEALDAAPELRAFLSRAWLTPGAVVEVPGASN